MDTTMDTTDFTTFFTTHNLDNDELGDADDDDGREVAVVLHVLDLDLCTDSDGEEVVLVTPHVY